MFFCRRNFLILLSFGWRDMGFDSIIDGIKCLVGGGCDFVGLFFGWIKDKLFKFVGWRRFEFV